MLDHAVPEPEMLPNETTAGVLPAATKRKMMIAGDETVVDDL
jgi:hypothetical protein